MVKARHNAALGNPREIPRFRSWTRLDESYGFLAGSRAEARVSFCCVGPDPTAASQLRGPAAAGLLSRDTLQLPLSMQTTSQLQGDRAPSEPKAYACDVFLDQRPSAVRPVLLESGFLNREPPLTHGAGLLQTDCVLRCSDSQPTTGPYLVRPPLSTSDNKGQVRRGDGQAVAVSCGRVLGEPISAVQRWFRLRTPC